jgi:O-antigen/teichoic acid export membrane protein
MKDSYRSTLRATSIIGSASVINMLISMLRMKAAAVLLGPAGVGLIGVFSNLVGVATSLAGMGLGNAGTRQIAEAAGKEDAASIAAARRGLKYLTALLAIIGTAVFWLLRGVVAEYVLHDQSRATQVGWLSLAVGFSIAAGSQQAMLNGLRRIGDLSLLSVYAAFWSSVLGIGALWLWGFAGVVAYVICVPLVGFLLGHWYVAKLPKAQSQPVQRAAITEQSRAMLKLGMAFMLTSSIGYSSLLLVQSLVKRELGIDALGFFQASSAISMTYIGFVIGAMGRDYFPRLTAIITDHQAVNRAVNQQIEISLLLAGPVFLAMMALAPWVITVLYSSKFHPASQVLYWQVIGDIVKVSSWPVAYILVASGAGRTFVKNEIVGLLSFGLLTWSLLPVFGIAGSGMAYLGLNIIALCIVIWQAKRRVNLILWRETQYQIAALLLSAVALLVLSRYSQSITALVGLSLSAVSAIYGFSRLVHKTEIGGRIGQWATVAQRWMKKLGVWRE